MACNRLTGKLYLALRGAILRLWWTQGFRGTNPPHDMVGVKCHHRILRLGACR